MHFVIELPQSMSVIAGLIPLFIYARQHPTNIILLGIWVGLPRIPPRAAHLAVEMRTESSKAEAAVLCCGSLADAAADACIHRACTRHAMHGVSLLRSFLQG